MCSEDHSIAGFSSGPPRDRLSYSPQGHLPAPVSRSLTGSPSAGAAMAPRAVPVPSQAFSKSAGGPAPSASARCNYNYSSGSKVSSSSRSGMSPKQSSKASASGGGKGIVLCTANKHFYPSYSVMQSCSSLLYFSKGAMSSRRR